MIRAALDLARRGLHVLPLWYPDAGRCACGEPDCASPAKHPLGILVPRGHHDATVDPDLVREWWTRYPAANVGIRTGVESGVLVLDRDDRNGGEVGWEELERLHGPIPYSIRARTGGGLHCYLGHPGGDVRIPSLRAVAPGVDLKADGGLVVAPPSVHISGRRYAWLDAGESRLEPAPAWIVERFARGRLPEPQGDAPAEDVVFLEDRHAEELIERRFLPRFRERVDAGGCRNGELVAFAFQCRANRIRRRVVEAYIGAMADVCRKSPKARRVHPAEIRRAIKWAYSQPPAYPSRDVEERLLSSLAGRRFTGDERGPVLAFVADALVRGTSEAHARATLLRANRHLCDPPLDAAALELILRSATARAASRPTRPRGVAA